MKSPSSEHFLPQAFDCYMKMTIKGAARNHYKKSKKRSEREALFSELTNGELDDLAVFDEYFMDEDLFEVMGLTVSVNHPELAEAISKLSDKKREVILLYYFFHLSDIEVAGVLGIPIGTVYTRRKDALEKLRKTLEAISNEQAL